MKKSFLIFGLIGLVLSGCTFQTKHRGYIFPDGIESDVKNLKTTTDLQDKLGSPQLKTIYGNPIWIYYGADENYHGPFPLTYDNKQALVVWVKDNNIVQTKFMHNSDFAKTKIADGETPIPAAIELNALQELFNNIGRFTPAGLGQ